LANVSKADIIIIGHSHTQFCKKIPQASFINPGSVGRPGNENPQTSYAILSFNPLNIELIKLDYKSQCAAQAMRKKGLPESFAQMLLRGVALETVINYDKAKENATTENCQKQALASIDLTKKCLQDTEHSTQVTKLALTIFDELSKLHKLGKQERCWLECASILHDVGLSTGESSHHKKSAKLILNETNLPFASNDRRIIANIARYHRKGLPKPKHYNLSSLDNKTICKIKVLTSILQVADGLDYSHQSNVKNLQARVYPKQILVYYFSEKKCFSEEQAFNKKKDLFEKVCSRNMTLSWKKP